MTSRLSEVARYVPAGRLGPIAPRAAPAIPFFHHPPEERQPASPKKRVGGLISDEEDFLFGDEMKTQGMGHRRHFMARVKHRPDNVRGGYQKPRRREKRRGLNAKNAFRLALVK